MNLAAEGKFIANHPSRHGPSAGRSDGGEWTFENGRLVHYSYESGEKDFSRMYRKAGPERDRPAIFSIGLNPKIHISPLYEDQGLGVVAVYVGANEYFGGSTKGDFRSWLFLSGANVRVDGKPLLKAGKIVS